MEFLKEILGDGYADFESKVKAYNDAHADKPVKIVNLTDGGYVDKEKYSRLETEANGYKDQIAERDKQLKTLKDAASGNEDLTAQIEQLQADNKTAKEKYEKELADSKFNYAVDLKLTQSGTRNVKALKALVDMEKVKLDGETLTGLDDQLEALKKEHDYLFAPAKDSTGMELGGAGTSSMDGVEKRFLERNPGLKIE